MFYLIPIVPNEYRFHYAIMFYGKLLILEQDNKPLVSPFKGWISVESKYSAYSSLDAIVTSNKNPGNIEATDNKGTAVWVFAIKKM